ncbi:ABC-2 transporter permease [Lacticaseibacillus rhamnosus]|uniref:ABC-2 transporter permease n=1 Tax=Lacticaseibacillus rhamnosus TaxID=47715 RepID=UPI00065AC1F4|nr:ABC-2 transporter permease [Lacticaseibacillus rhamnosus]KMO47062.1 hypothetical protein PY95_06445 [Lacticaseibacillus rhamnosus]OAU02218.1 hypothetical protein PY72_06445 [Lacticaseibacillus rhamnosus]
MRDLVKLVGLDFSSFLVMGRRYLWWSLVISIALYVIPFLNGDFALPLACGNAGASISILMMPFACADRHGLEKLYSMLPVRRSTIVASHYIFGLIVAVIIDLFSLLIIGVGMVARNNPIHDPLSSSWILIFGAGLVFFQLIFSFPLMIGFGFQRAVLSSYLPFAFILILLFLDSTLDIRLDALRPWYGAIAILFILALAFSWWLSTVLYKKREF